MTAILEKLTLYWAYPFVRYALIVGVLIALCSSLLGVTLVLKRFSFIVTVCPTWRSARWRLPLCCRSPTKCPL